MRYSYHYFITLSSLFLMCNAMEIVTELRETKNVRFLEYLNKDCIVIAGLDGCDILNVKTKEIKNINKDAYVRGTGLAVHPQGNKIMSANGDWIRIYDANGNQQAQREYGSFTNYCTFSGLHNSLFIRSYKGFDIYDYVTGTCTHKKVKNITDLAINDVTKSIAITNTDRSDRTLFLYKLDNLTTPYKKIDRLKTSSSCTYNKAGSMIAVSNARYVLLIDLEKETENIFEIESERGEELTENFNKVFFVNNSVLGIFSEVFLKGYEDEYNRSSTLRYYDTIAKQCLYKIDHLFSHVCDLSCSPDEEHIAFAADERCVIMSVPWQVRYELDIKSKFPFLLFVVHQLRKKYFLPMDVSNYCATFLLHCFK